MDVQSASCIFSRHAPAALTSSGSLHAEDFDFERSCGAGYLSTVSLVRHKRSGLRFALKAYSRRKIKEQETKQIMREVENHLELDLHPNVVTLYGVFFDDDNFYLVLEYCAQGDLFQELHRKTGRMSESVTVQKVLAPFLRALRFLHSRGIVHRDIKPENLLFDEHGTLKLADFGLSINTEVERPMTRVGTLDYISPEVIVRPDPEEEGYQAGGYDGACDAWATGVLCYECLCGSAPFDRGRKQATVEAILKCEFELPSFLSEDARTFILAALARDPNKRPTIEELSQFRWIQKHTRLTRGSFSAATSTAVASAPLGVSPAASASASSLMGRSPHQLLAHAFPHQRSPAVNALLGNRRGSLRPFGPGAPPADYRSAPSTVSSSPAIPIVHGALANGSLSKGPASPSAIETAPKPIASKPTAPSSMLVPQASFVPQTRIVGFGTPSGAGSREPSNDGSSAVPVPLLPAPYTFSPTPSLTTAPSGSRRRLLSRTGMGGIHPLATSFTAQNPPPELVLGALVPASPHPSMPWIAGGGGGAPPPKVSIPQSAASAPSRRDLHGVHVAGYSHSARNVTTEEMRKRRKSSLKTVVSAGGHSDGNLSRGLSSGQHLPQQVNNKAQVVIKPTSAELCTAPATPVGPLMKGEGGRGLGKLFKRLWN